MVAKATWVNKHIHTICSSWWTTSTAREVKPPIIFTKATNPSFHFSLTPGINRQPSIHTAILAKALRRNLAHKCHARTSLNFKTLRFESLISDNTYTSISTTNPSRCRYACLTYSSSTLHSSPMQFIAHHHPCLHIDYTPEKYRHEEFVGTRIERWRR